MSTGKSSAGGEAERTAPYSERDALRQNFRDCTLRYICSAAAHGDEAGKGLQDAAQVGSPAVATRSCKSHPVCYERRPQQRLDGSPVSRPASPPWAAKGWP